MDLNYFYKDFRNLCLIYYCYNHFIIIYSIIKIILIINFKKFIIIVIEVIIIKFTINIIIITIKLKFVIEIIINSSAVIDIEFKIITHLNFIIFNQLSNTIIFNNCLIFKIFSFSRVLEMHFIIII